MTLRLVLVVVLLSGGVTLTARDQSPARFEALVGLARVKRDAGDPESARRYFEQARQLQPFDAALDAEYFWVLAEVAPTDAVAAGRSLLARRPGADDVRERSIAVAAASGDETTALALAVGGAEHDPARALWHRRVAESHARHGRAAEAARAWNAAISASGSENTDRAGLALALEAAGEHTRALAVWEQLPVAMRRDREDWERSRLRALASTASAADAAGEIDAWLTTHPADVTMRESLVELWRRAGRADRAIAALQPLLAGPERRRWLGRDVELALAADLTDVAMARLDQMVAAGEATRTDQLTLAELLIDAGAFDRARVVLTAIWGSPSACDAAIFGLIDRIPGAAGTSLLIAQLRVRDCGQSPQWILRGIDRAIAEGRHPEALALVEMLPPGRRQVTDIQRLDGQLRLWTGDAVAAVRRLAPLVDADPTDLPARDALVDAYRGTGDAYAAWRSAGPMVEARDTPPARLLALAELALEADQPHVVEALLARVPAEVAPPPVRLGLEGRALAALGRPADAVRVLSLVPASDRTPAATLALVDSLHSTSGSNVALEAARQTPVAGTDGSDLLARRVMLESLTSTEPSSSRRALADANPALPIFVDAEVALAQQRPLDALAILSTLPADVQPQRTADLRATALAESGNLQAAFDALTRLRQARPDFVPFVLREAELTWRLRPGEETLAGVLALQTRFPENRYAAVTAARVLALDRRHDAVITVLGGVSALAQLPIEGRVLMARSLSATGAAEEALSALVNVQLRGAAAVFRAELIARVEGREAGARAFGALVDQPDVSADLFLAWATVTADTRERLVVLETGAERFANSAPLLSSLAAARAAAGDAEGSRVAAERAVLLDSGSGEAWFRLIAGTAATRPPDELSALLERFTLVAQTTPALAVAIADRVAALVRSAHDPLLTSALGWLRVDVSDPSLVVSRDVAMVRLLAAGERWPEAIEAVDRAATRHPEAVAVLRLRADVLSWAGRHDDGIVAYDDYLTVVPDDVDARRQQARVAGWAGRFHDARRYYEGLRAAYPDDEAIEAEAHAKIAFFEGRWREASGRYERWLRIEPDNSEARFEWAEALRAAGDAESADAELAALSPAGGHRLAEAARDRETWRREPSVTAVADVSSASGYDGRRLLDLRTTGAQTHVLFGHHGRTTIGADAGSVVAASGDVTRSGYQLGARGTHRLSRTAALDGRMSIWDVSGPGQTVVLGAAGAAWSPADRWTLQGGADRELLLDNLSTIDRRLMATGAFVGATFESPHASLGMRASWQGLSDGNARSRVSLTATRAVSDTWRQVRAIVWAEALDYGRPADAYFAPERFLRIDGGLEYTHLFAQPRFRGDRMDQVAIGYLLGTDSRGAIYQHPSLRFGWELSPAMALSVRADLVRSSSYNERSLLVSLHLLGGAFSR